MQCSIMHLIQFTSDRYANSHWEKCYFLAIHIEHFKLCMFVQAHSIQELARKKFQELRDEGIPTENQLRNEQKFRVKSCNREPIKKPVLRYSDDDVGFLPPREQVKRPNLKGPEDTSFKGQVRKPISRTLQDESSFHKERVKKPMFRNSEEDLSSSFHKERAKKPVSRNSEDDLSSSFRKEEVRKAISRNSENDESSSFNKQQIKKPVLQSLKDDLSSHKKHVRKPICLNKEGSHFSSRKELVENSICTNGDDADAIPIKRLAEMPIGKNKEDLGHSHQESSRKHIRRDGQDDVGYSCNEQAITEPVRVISQGGLSSDVSGATIASTGDVSNGLSMSQSHATEPAGCTTANGVLDKDNSSPLDEIKSEKTDDIPGTVFFLMFSACLH
jgi:bromodomain-containing protein 9